MRSQFWYQMVFLICIWQFDYYFSLFILSSCPGVKEVQAAHARQSSKSPRSATTTTRRNSASGAITADTSTKCTWRSLNRSPAIYTLERSLMWSTTGGRSSKTSRHASERHNWKTAWPDSETSSPLWVKLVRSQNWKIAPKLCLSKKPTKTSQKSQKGQGESRESWINRGSFGISHYNKRRPEKSIFQRRT